MDSRRPPSTVRRNPLSQQARASTQAGKAQSNAHNPYASLDDQIRTLMKALAALYDKVEQRQQHIESLRCAPGEDYQHARWVEAAAYDPGGTLTPSDKAPLRYIKLAWACLPGNTLVYPYPWEWVFDLHVDALKLLVLDEWLDSGANMDDSVSPMEIDQHIGTVLSRMPGDERHGQKANGSSALALEAHCLVHQLEEAINASPETSNDTSPLDAIKMSLKRVEMPLDSMRLRQEAKQAIATWMKGNNEGHLANTKAVKAAFSEMLVSDLEAMSPELKFTDCYFP